MKFKKLPILIALYCCSGCGNSGKYPIIDPLKSSTHLADTGILFNSKADSSKKDLYANQKSKKEVPPSSVSKSPGSEISNSGQTIFGKISASVDHTLFIAAIEATGVDNLLDGKNNYTVLAPTDEAFKKLPRNILNSLLKPSNKEKVHTMMLNHIINDKVDLHQLKDGTLLKTLGGQSLLVKNRDGRTTINGASILSGEINCKNGFLNITTEVIQ